MRTDAERRRRPRLPGGIEQATSVEGVRACPESLTGRVEPCMVGIPHGTHGALD